MSESPAYLIGHISVRDAEKWAEYRGRVPDTLKPWGGELVFRGRRVEVLSGEHAHADTVVIRFPSAAALAAWHDSLAYQALIPLRKQAADMVLIAYES
ncbi:MAG TPA: DUF1330 domain-containing protein [Burkholderiales bacterium]